MTRVHFTLETTVQPERILAAATDFSERRPDLWPNISRRFYRVHEAAASHAEATEGSDTMGGIWAREHYDWSTPGTVRGTVQASNVFEAGGTWEIHVRPRDDGGSRIELIRDRKGKNLKGRLIEGMLALGGRKILASGLLQTLAILERQSEEPSGSLSLQEGA